VTNPIHEIRTGVAGVLRAQSRVGNVYERQMHTTSWEEFSNLFGWTDPSTERGWVRGWLVMPAEEVAGVRESSYGSADVNVSITSRVLVRGIQSLSEGDSQYEDFFDVAYNVFLALAKRKRYTVSEPAQMILQPGVRWDSYKNRRIGGAACHTAEMVVSFQYEVTHDLEG
jgi:hypothetical protein